MLVNLKAIAHKVTDSELLQLSSDNPDTRFETTKEGKLIIMSPTGSSTGAKNSSLLAQIWFWNNKHKQGKVFDSSTGFVLSNGAIKSPDVSWIELSRWNNELCSFANAFGIVGSLQAATKEQQDKFAPIDPDFASQRVVLKDTAPHMGETPIVATDEGVIELRSEAMPLGLSPNDRLDELQQKMEEYISCGVKLGWLINPRDKQVALKD